MKKLREKKSQILAVMTVIDKKKNKTSDDFYGVEGRMRGF